MKPVESPLASIVAAMGEHRPTRAATFDVRPNQDCYLGVFQLFVCRDHRRRDETSIFIMESYQFCSPLMVDVNHTLGSRMADLPDRAEEPETKVIRAGLAEQSDQFGFIVLSGRSDVQLQATSGFESCAPLREQALWI